MTAALPYRIARRVSHGLQFRLDKVLAEPANRRLDAMFRRDPATWLERMAAATDKGTGWFEGHLDLTMSALLALDQARRQTGNPTLDFVADRIGRYADTYYDPGLRCVDRDYDPHAHRHLPDIVETRPYQIIELLMIDAGNIDRGGDPEHLMRYLTALSDGGGYGSTHIIVGGLLMKRAGCDHPGIDGMIAKEVMPVARANGRTSYAGDLFAERIFVLEWLGRHDLVRPSWLIRLLRAQRSDGGWKGRNIPPFGQSNQHTTSLAIAALTQFVAAETAVNAPA